MKILVGISGGVDSAFAANLLIERGHSVTGCILSMHEWSDTKGAETVCGELGIELIKLDCSERFNRIVKADFVNEYSRGRTPNPCIICNEQVKFAALYEYATQNGFDMIATGHYAKISSEEIDGAKRFFLECADDLKKDQTYMLYRLPEHILAKTMFPLGSLTKDEVRRLSALHGLSAAAAKDSQEICFLPDGGYAEYIESVKGKSMPGSFVDGDGNVLGEHKGIIRYTVGQRKGLGIALGRRMFVSAIDPEANTVTLSDKIKGKNTVKVSDIILSKGIKIEQLTHLELYAKLRYTAPLVRVRVELKDSKEAVLYTDDEVKAAPGQSAVIYSNGRVIFGGIIDG